MRASGGVGTGEGRRSGSRNVPSERCAIEDSIWTNVGGNAISSMSPTMTEHAHSRRKRAAAALVKRGRRAKRALPFESSSGAAG